MSVRVEQCLHGYGDGHERLAASVGLPDAEAYRLDRMSDLSGYPGKQDPPPYTSGYPCGRWYVVARTWIDPSGERRGTVFTHSILVPLSEIGAIENLASFVPLFRQPSYPVERHRWTVPLELAPRSAPRVDPVAAAAWFEEETPLVWTGDDPEGAVGAVWASLPAGDRGDFRFCTHALLPRYLDDRLFDWMGAPRQLLLDYGSARRQLRERDRVSPLPAWLLAARWPPDWRDVEASLPGLGRGNRRPALRFAALRAGSSRDELLGAADLLDRLRVAPGSPTAAGLFRALLDRSPEPDFASLQDLLAREPLRWAPDLEDALCGWVYAAVARLGGSLEDAQLDRLLAYGGAPGRSARESLRQSASVWPDELILRRLGQHPELFGDWIFRLPSKRRRVLLDSATGAVRALLASDLRGLETLVEPGDPTWIEVALAMPDARHDDRGLRRVLRRVGPEALLTWAREVQRDGSTEVPRVLLELLAEDCALTGVLRSGDGGLVERVLSRVEDDDLRVCLRADPLAAAPAWRVLAAASEPTVARSRLARALLGAGEAPVLFALLAEEAQPLASIRDRDVGVIVGAVLRAALQPTPPSPTPGCGNAAALLGHPTIAPNLERIPRKDVDWLLAEADVAATVGWVARDPSLARHDPRLLLDLVQAWSRRGWPAAASADLLRVLDALDEDRRVYAAGPLLWACLQSRRDADLPLVARAFPLVHGAMLADKNVFHEVRDWFTEHWDKAKVPRRALLRAWAQESWPPALLDESFPTPKAWEHLVRTLRDEVPPAERARFLRWLRQDRPVRFRELPRALRSELDER